MQPRPSTPASRRTSRARLAPSGFTLLELLLATVIGVAMIGVALSLMVSNRRVYELDRARTQLNQNLRSAMDVVGIDIRQAGERLPIDFPAVAVANGANGGPDTLVIRRNLLDTVLPVCAPIVPGQAGNVAVSLPTGTPNPPAGCSPGGATASLAAWEAYRTANQSADGSVAAYIYNVGSQLGEFFAYGGVVGGEQLRRVGGTFQGNYPAGTSRVYILEERRYTLDPAARLLQLSVNGGAPQGVATGVTGFQLEALVGPANNAFDEFGPLTPQAATSWVALTGITVRLNGASAGRNANLQRSLSAQFLPRNVFSP